MNFDSLFLFGNTNISCLGKRQSLNTGTKKLRDVHHHLVTVLLHYVREMGIFLCFLAISMSDGIAPFDLKSSTRCPNNRLSLKIDQILFNKVMETARPLQRRKINTYRVCPTV